MGFDAPTLSKLQISKSACKSLLRVPDDLYESEFIMPATTLHPRIPRLGELLVAQGLLRQSEVDAVLSRQNEIGRPFGVLCEEMFGIDPVLIEAAWVDQYRALSAAFDADFACADPAAIALVMARQAWQFRIFPLRIEHGTLIAATTPGHLARASRFATRVIGMAALFVVVDAHELASALETHYPIDGMTVQTVRALHGVGSSIEPHAGVGCNGNTRT
ncbi:MAG: hypothetical protein EXS15_05885 [Phycisphaerales bacterium]|nr:hypothetical protein [Phycisphaerales bacterium]